MKFAILLLVLCSSFTVFGEDMSFLEFSSPQSCSPRTSDSFCTGFSVNSSCESISGVGVCSLIPTIPVDQLGMPACTCKL